MRFSIRQRIGRVKFSLVIGTITKVQGINSTLKDGNHIVMWEFDRGTLDEVKYWLSKVQADYLLPCIYIAQSHPGGGYHAYCLSRETWLQSVCIVAGTEGIDPGYVSMCAMRGHWTLRLTDKGQGAPEFSANLESDRRDQVAVNELVSWVDYEVWSNTDVLTLGKRGL